MQQHDRSQASNVASLEAAVYKAFENFDENGNGLITRHDVSKVLRKLNSAYWNPHRLEALLGAFSQDHGSISYSQFLEWLFRTRRTAPVVPRSAGRNAASSDPVSFSLMTFNVEEYYHGHSSNKQEAQLKDHVFETVRGIRALVEQQSPDVLCIEEHSLGSGFTEAEIMEVLLGDLGFEYVSYPTGENHAWYSPLANAVVWKGARFKLIRSWRVELAGPGDVVPGTGQHYTPRAATCAELEHTTSTRRVVICATHLLGGRFEDTSFIAEALAGRNVRSEQAKKIASSIRARCGDEMPSVIAGDFNVMNEGFREGSPFRQNAEKYFQGKQLGGALSVAANLSAGLKKEDYTYDTFFVPFQTRVHHTFCSELGYCVAYGRRDDISEMKTTHYAGCIDWVYIRNLKSLGDERVVSAIDEGLSDHNAVVVTLTLA